MTNRRASKVKKDAKAEGDSGVRDGGHPFDNNNNGATRV